MKLISMDKSIDLWQIEKSCRSANEPTFFLGRLYIRLVAMDIDYFERTIQKYYEFQSVPERLKDIEEGETVEQGKLLTN